MEQQKKQIVFKVKVTRTIGQPMDADAYALLIAEVNRALVNAARENLSTMAETGHINLVTLSIKVSGDR